MVVTRPSGSTEMTPAGHVGEDRLHVAAALLELEVARLEVGGHLVERADQRADLVVGRDLRPVAETDAVLPVALRDLARALGEPLDRHRDALREIEADPGGAEEHEQA